MKVKRNFPFVSFLVMIVLSAAACRSSNTQVITNNVATEQSNASRNMNQPPAPNVEVETGIEGLEKQINLPLRPLEVKWAAEIFDNSKGTVPGPSDRRLTVLLKYDDKTAAELARRLAGETAENSMGKTDVKFWFPVEVANEAKTVDGRTYLEGIKYSSDDFARAPYRNGSLIRVEGTNYFVLNLNSF